MKIKINPEKILGKETRLDLEKDIVHKMIGMYCKGQGHCKKVGLTAGAADRADQSEHAQAADRAYCQAPSQGNALCQDCTALYNYALERLDACPFGQEKTFCSQCPIHCYQAEKREEIRKVMAWSGPRMIFHHPLMAIVYLTKKLWYN